MVSAQRRPLPAPMSGGADRPSPSLRSAEERARLLDALERGKSVALRVTDDAEARALLQEIEDEARSRGFVLETRRAGDRLALRSPRRFREADREYTPAIAPGKEALYRLFAQICQARPRGLDLETREGLPSLEKLARAAGLGKGTLANIIRTPYVPKAETLNKVSALAEWDEDLLLQAAGLRSAPRHATLSAEEELILSAFQGADRAAVDYALTLVRAALQYASGRGSAPPPPPASTASAAPETAGHRTGAAAPAAPTAD